MFTHGLGKKKKRRDKKPNFDCTHCDHSTQFCLQKHCIVHCSSSKPVGLSWLYFVYHKLNVHLLAYSACSIQLDESIDRLNR